MNKSINKEKYQAPQVEVLGLNTEGIICASGEGMDPDPWFVIQPTDFDPLI